MDAEPLLERLDRLVDLTAAAFWETLDDTERPTAKLYLHKTALVADDAWGHTVRGHHGSSVVGPLVPDEERADPFLMEEDDNEEISYFPTCGARA